MSMRRIYSTALLIAVVPSVLLPAQQRDSPKDFLASIYRHYQHGGKGIDISGRSASRYFTASLLALVRADANAVGPENVGAIDADPICACQDWEGIWNLEIDVKPQDSKHAEADVAFSLSPPASHAEDSARKLVIQLVSEQGAWRIDDIVDSTDAKNSFALRKALTDDIALNRRMSKAVR